ncbi:hypothetical protein Trydic_g12748 [Trypoxylus dichotomus]
MAILAIAVTGWYAMAQCESDGLIVRPSISPLTLSNIYEIHARQGIIHPTPMRPHLPDVRDSVNSYTASSSKCTRSNLGGIHKLKLVQRVRMGGYPFSIHIWKLHPLNYASPSYNFGNFSGIPREEAICRLEVLGRNLTRFRGEGVS